MPNVQDSQVALAGSIVAIELTTNYETKQPDGGSRVSVLAGDGMSVVKLSPEATRAIGPIVNDRVAWMIRNQPWSMDGGRSGMSSQLVRLVDHGDIDLLSSIVTAVEQKVGK